MKYKFPLFLCLLFGWILLPTNGYAQPDSQSVPDGKISSRENDSHVSANDTALQKKAMDDDNIIQKYRSRREFAYMYYLDSALRNHKRMRTGKASLDEKNKQIKRDRQQAKPSAISQLLNSLPLKIFFWTLALIFISFISYKAFFKKGYFARRSKPVNEEIEESVTKLSEISVYSTLIAAAENANELNLATRYLFLKTLKYLSEKQFIIFTPEKTNKDYLKEMEQNHYFPEFRQLTRNYEYIWYGKFLIHREAYQRLKEEFDLFNKKV